MLVEKQQRYEHYLGANTIFFGKNDQYLQNVMNYFLLKS